MNSRLLLKLYNRPMRHLPQGFIIASLMLCSCTASWGQPQQVEKTNPLKVYMHYMPWFETPDTLGGNQWGFHWKFANRNPNIVDGQGRRQIASHFYPMIGPYASRDPDVIEYHLLLMKYSGADGIMIDWYGVQGTNGDIGNLLTSSNAIVDQVDDVGLQFGVVLEDRFSANVMNGQANVAYLRDNYFDRPEYIRSGASDDPLMMVFGPITFQQPSDWTQILASAGEDVDLLTLWYESADAGDNADGEFAWIYEDAGLDNYDSHVKNFYRYRAPGLTTAAGIAFPGFEDFYEEGGLGEVVPFDIPHDNGQTLATTLALANQYQNQMDMLQLATWNDFGEGTVFEPTVETGFDYLLQLQQFTGTPFGQSELELVYQLYRARKSFAGDTTKQSELDEVAELLAALQLDDARTLLDSLTMPGDFDGNGVVNGKDFLLWQRQCGMNGLYPLANLPADGNADGVVDMVDFSLWQQHFGSLSRLGTLAAHVAIPEQSNLVQGVLFLLAAIGTSRSAVSAN